MTTSDEVRGFFILPSINSSPNGPRAPAIKVTLVKNSMTPIASNIVAMLNTGTSEILVDEDLARDLEFVREGAAATVGFVNRPVKIYKCGIFIEEFKQLLPFQCATAELQKSGRNFRAILGMHFINQFDFIIKAKEEEVSLRRPTG